jgi:hypothetical protein|tara:strand:- start:645 stop:1097 length:453 start_codon:yes stop_codon:yes gene_type:complete
MAVTVAPSTEAMSAITDRINSGTAYSFDIAAEYTDEVIDPLEEIAGLRVDVVSESEEQLEETLDAEDRTSHVLRIWVRQKVDDVRNGTVDPLKLLVRQIFQRVNDYDSTDGRVAVWEVDTDAKQTPDKVILRQHWLFIASIVLRVEVEAS